MHVYMCTDNVCTWSRAHMQLPGMPSQAKTKLRGTKHEISPPLLSIECIRYLHSTLPFKPVVPSNSNVSHISILFPGIFFFLIKFGISNITLESSDPSRNSKQTRKKMARIFLQLFGRLTIRQWQFFSGRNWLSKLCKSPPQKLQCREAWQRRKLQIFKLQKGCMSALESTMPLVGRQQVSSYTRAFKPSGYLPTH